MSFMQRDPTDQRFALGTFMTVPSGNAHAQRRDATDPPVLTKNRCERAPAESLPAPKNFLQKRLSHKGYPPLWDRTIFGQVFVRGGLIKFSKWKVPLPRGQARPAIIEALVLQLGLRRTPWSRTCVPAASLKVKSRPIFRSCGGPSSTWSSTCKPPRHWTSIAVTFSCIRR